MEILKFLTSTHDFVKMITRIRRKKKRRFYFIKFNAPIIKFILFLIRIKKELKKTIGFLSILSQITCTKCAFMCLHFKKFQMRHIVNKQNQMEAVVANPKEPVKNQRN